VLAVNAVFGRQRAERFAQLLDEAGGARRHHARSRADQDLNDFVEVSHRLGRIDFGVQADPEFKDGLRAMLMATIEREGIGATAVDAEPTARVGTPRRRPAGSPSWLPIRSRRARGAVVVGLAVGTLAISGISAASGDAMPGDSLYGVKRTGEKAQLAMAGSQVSRGQLYLDFAKTRLNEAAGLRGDAPGMTALLDEMDNETREGVRLLTTSAVDRRDTAALDAVEGFSGQQRQTLTGMLGTLTGTARNRTVTSLQLLDSINKRTDGLRGTLRCSDIASAGADDLGPRAGRCAAQGQLQPSTAGGANGATAGGSTQGGNGAVEPGEAAPRDNQGSDPSTTGNADTGGSTANRNAPAPGDTATRPAAEPDTVVSSKEPASTPEDSKHADEGLIDRIGHLLGG
jgi:hypothetical protein